MKLYTKRGDEGLTDLWGNRRVPKDALRVEAYGTLDELSSFLGLAAAGCELPDALETLRQVQSQLLDLGAELARPTPTSGTAGQRAKATAPKSKRAKSAKASAVAPGRITDQLVRQLERKIDLFHEPVPPMRHFILPGGTELAARLHVARTVCRRAERLCVTLARQEPVSPSILIYLNRLSDLLFAMSRYANFCAGVADVPWLGGRR